jgi:hypothetical protein
LQSAGEREETKEVAGVELTIDKAEFFECRRMVSWTSPAEETSLRTFYLRPVDFKLSKRRMLEETSCFVKRPVGETFEADGTCNN